MCNKYQHQYKTRLQLLNIMPLTFRREILDLTFFHKCISGKISIDVENYIEPRSERLRRDQYQTNYKPSQCKTTTFKNSYFNRIIPLWNNLPSEVQRSNSMSEFKRKVTDFYKNRLACQFDVNNICSWFSLCRCDDCWNQNLS